MQRYIIRRTLLAIVTLWIVTVLLFGMLWIMPGDTVDELLLEAGVSLSTSERDELRHVYGLDRPIVQRYFDWLLPILKGDLGRSIVVNVPISQLIRERLPNTFVLGTLTLALSLAISLPVGVIAAMKADRPQDYLARGFAVMGLSTPSFWLAIIVLVFPAHYWGWTPPLRYSPLSDGFWDWSKIFLMPALIGGMFGSASTMRLTRALLLEVLRSDYIRTAHAKGLTQTIVVWRHALKNAMIPVVTIVGTQMSFILGGSVIMESIFNIPGMGSLLRTSIIFKDFIVVQSLVLILATFVLAINLFVDITYAWLDPRIKYA